MLLVRRWLIWGIVVSVVVGLGVEGIVLLVIVTWFQWIVMFVVLVVSVRVVDVLYGVLRMKSQQNTR
jgi:hypothetical protein